jgi:histidinol-phosphate phosphatase family protein
LEELNEMTDEMKADIEAAGGRINGVFYCLHQKSDGCDCKKPKTKLFLEAVKGRKVDFKDVYFIGDSREDIEAGKALGCNTVLVLSGRTQPADMAAFEPKPGAVKNDLLEAVTWILSKKR